MAISVFQSAKQLVKDAAGVIYYRPGTDEAQAITASKNGGNFGAVNAGTTGADHRHDLQAHHQRG